MFETKHTDIQEKIKFDILHGRFGGRHAKLPPFRKLASEYEVSPVTISKAMSKLRDSNIIDIRGTRGAFVKENVKARERFNNIAVINKSLGDHAGLLAGEILESYADKHNIGLISMGVAQNVSIEPSLFTSLRADGFIFMDSSLTPDVAEAMSKAKIPFVSLSRLDSEFASWIDYDNEGGLAEVLESFIESGYKRIGFLDFKNDYFGYQKRIYQVYKNILSKSGCFDEKLFIARDTKKEMRVRYGREFADNAGKLMAEYLLELDELPDALVLSNGFIYNNVNKACMERGVNLADKMSVVIHVEDAQDYPQDVSLLLSPFKKKVKLGFELLHKQILTRNLSPQQITLKHKLIIK